VALLFHNSLTGILLYIKSTIPHVNETAVSLTRLPAGEMDVDGTKKEQHSNKKN
jgi:hypothetical protein